MVFGKDQKNVSELGRKGAINRNKKHGSPFIEKWKDKDWVNKKSKSSQESMKRLRATKTEEEWIEHCRLAGKKSRKRENKTIENIKDEYDKIFIPSRVCDRIAIKDGKIIFIEAKPKKRKKLTPKQQEFKEECDKFNIEYIVVTD